MTQDKTTPIAENGVETVEQANSIYYQVNMGNTISPEWVSIGPTAVKYYEDHGYIVREHEHANQPPPPPDGSLEKYCFVFKHPDGTTLTSRYYTTLELLATDIETIQEKTLDCACKPTGENQYKDCNCDDYYDLFLLSATHSLRSAQQVDAVAVIDAMIENYELEIMHDILSERGKSYNKVRIDLLTTLKNKIQ